MLFLFSFLFCGGNNPAPGDGPICARQCPFTEKTYSFDEIEFSGGKGDGRIKLSDLRDGINSACMNCHQAPAQSGGFSSSNSFHGEVRTISGQTSSRGSIYSINYKVSKKVQLQSTVYKNENLVDIAAVHGD